MYTHKLFTMNIRGRWLVYVPTLNKLFEVNEQTALQLPLFITDESPIPISRWANLLDYQFLGTNLLLTDGCNLACGYCYEFGIPLRNPKTMPLETATAAIDYVVNCAQSVKAERFYANMFGGEPTQAFDLLCATVEYMRQRGIETGLRSRATITTNGVMSQEQASWLAANMDAVTISFDGPREIQNLQRSRSYDAVLRTTKLVHKLAPTKLSLRATISDFSVLHLTDIVRFFGDSFPGCRIFLEPVFAIGRGKQGKIGMPNHREFFQQFVAALPMAREHGCKLKTSVLNIGAKAMQFCGVPGNNFMIGPDGTISVCNRMMSKKEEASDRFIYGRYDDTEHRFVFDDQKYRWLKQLTLASIPGCESCFASSHCRGDCAANKAVLNPNGFERDHSYRCQELKEFIGQILLYVLDTGDEVTTK